jgi:hypothetical protein
MSDDRSEEQDEQPSIVHDNIVKRLLDYQRQLREGATPVEAAEQAQGDRPMIDYQAAETPVATQTDTIEVVDVAAAEAESEAELEETAPEALEGELEAPADEAAADVIHIPEAESEPAAPAPSASTDDPSARVAALETEMARLGEMVSALRDTFQDMAITADERLAAIEEAIATSTGGAASE